MAEAVLPAYARLVITPTAEELTTAYREFRLRLTELGRSLDPAVADAKTPTCPEWSVKDVVAHMTGIAADILDGNIAEAATEPWADAQVDKRRELTLAEVLDEWDTKGPLLEELLAKVAPAIAFQFYIDAFTHEWDIRQALGTAPVAPDFSLVAHTMPTIGDALSDRLQEQSLLPVELVLHGLPTDPYQFTFDGSPADRQARAQVSIELDAFEFLRLSMGRRSLSQIENALGTVGIREGAWADAFVFWTANDHDIVDPVLPNPVAG